jgi:hypothetical protein
MSRHHFAWADGTNPGHTAILTLSGTPARMLAFPLPRGQTGRGTPFETQARSTVGSPTGPIKSVNDPLVLRKRHLTPPS